MTDRIVYCAKCGRQVAPILARLGSIYCHDHRKPGNVKHGGFNA